MPNTIDNNTNYPEISQSNAWYERAREVIPAGTQTLAKGSGQFVRGVAPAYLARGKGARVWDVDGNEYLDFSMAVGPLSLGYCDQDVDEAIRRQLEDGISFSLVHPLEVEVAELVRQTVPAAEMVRFSKTGAEATSAAVRLARAYTGRSKVLCCGYHGWHDWFISVTDRDRGVPRAVADLTYTFEYNDLESVTAAFDDEVACVILEPVTFVKPRQGFLQGLRKLCTERGALLIFDEMWTGFRIALGGAEQYFGVSPDLACFSKAVANGMPLSLLTGRREFMQLLEREVFFFTTFGGETLSLAAAKAAIAKLQRERVPEHIASLGTKIHQGLTELVQKLDMPYVKSVGLPYRTMMSFDGEYGNPLQMKSLLQQELIRRGLLWNGFHNLCLAHGERDIDYLLGAYAEALPVLREAVNEHSVTEMIKGQSIEPVFRKTHKFNSKPRVDPHPDRSVIRLSAR